MTEDYVRGYLEATTEIALWMEATLAGGWDVGKVQHNWKKKIEDIVRKMNGNQEIQDDPARYHVLFEMQEIRELGPSDGSEGAKILTHRFPDSPTDGRRLRNAGTPDLIRGKDVPQNNPE